MAITCTRESPSLIRQTAVYRDYKPLLRLKWSGETARVRMTSKFWALVTSGKGDFGLTPTLCSDADVTTHFCDVCISCPFELISLDFLLRNAEK